MELPRSKTVLEALGGLEAWGKSYLRVLPKSKLEEVKLPRGAGFSEFAIALKRDYIVLSRSFDTWKAYRAWWSVFWLGAGALESRGSQLRPTATCGLILWWCLWQLWLCAQGKTRPLSKIYEEMC